MGINKRNKTDIQAIDDLVNSKKKFLNAEILQSRIEANLKIWESQSKYKKLPYKPQVAKYIKSVPSVRLIIKSIDAEGNEKVGFSVAKHLVNHGLDPNKISIVSIDECYLHYRGFGNDGKEVRDKVFGEDVECLLLTNVTDNKATNIQDNVEGFWQELLLRLEKDKKFNLIICLDGSKTNKWFFQSKEIKQKIEKIDFKVI